MTTVRPELLDELRERARPAGAAFEISLGWFHRYPARFAGEVVDRMLVGAMRRLEGTRLELCLDPFAGTGATMAACRQLGIPSSGVELSRLGVAIAQLRLDPPDDVEAAIARIEQWAAREPAHKHRLNPELVEWLGDDNARSVTRYLASLRALRDPREKRFATVAVSQALRPSSRWLAGSVKVTADPDRVPPPIEGPLLRFARVIARDCVAERDGWYETEPAATVVQGDSVKLALADGSVDVVITSPPYYITYDYFEVQRLSYLAFGWATPRELQVGMRFGISRDGVGFIPPPAMRHWYYDEFRGETTLYGRALRAYWQRMDAHFREVFRVVRPGGVIAYAVANSTRRNQKFDLVKAMTQAMATVGFTEIETRARGLGDKHILPATRDVSSGRFATVGEAGVAERLIFAKRPERRGVPAN